MRASQIFPTVREAINHTATRSGVPQKQLAADLDWAPSTFSLVTTLGDENARPFPADDAHLVRLMTITEDYSILATLADKCGFELVPRRDRMPAMVEEVRKEVAALTTKVQMMLDMPGIAPAAPKKSGR